MFVLDFYKNFYEHDALLIVELLRKSKIKVRKQAVNDILRLHPDFPSILSISDCLKELGVDNAVVKVERNYLQKIPLPCIAHSIRCGFIIIESITLDQVFYSTWDGSKSSTLFATFTDNWSGVLLITAIDKSYRRLEPATLSTERLKAVALLFSPILMCLLYTLLSVRSNNFCTPECVFILLKSLGLIIATTMILHETYLQNSTLQKLCSIGKKFNCDAILNSKASHVFKWLSWSEIGFFYYSGTFLLLLFLGRQNNQILLALAWLNTLSLPFIIYSLYYQWRIAKQWCTLCLSILFIFVTESLLSLHFGLYTEGIDIQKCLGSLLVPFVSAFIIPSIIWYAIKPILLAAKRESIIQKKYRHLKLDISVFKSLLYKQEQISSEPKNMGISLGDARYSTHLILVSNPNCIPCAKAYKTIEELLETNSISIQIILITPKFEQDSKALVAKHLLAISKRESQQTTRNALDLWYNSKEHQYSTWSELYPVHPEEIVEQENNIESMRVWCENEKITYTPSIFIDGHKLPETYDIEDLIFLLR